MHLKDSLIKQCKNLWLFNSATLLYTSSNSAIPGSASFQRLRNFSQCSMAFAFYFFSKHHFILYS